MRDDRCNMSRAQFAFYTSSGIGGESTIVFSSAPPAWRWTPLFIREDRWERMFGIAGTAAELLGPCRRPIVALDVHRLCKRR